METSKVSLVWVVIAGLAVVAGAIGLKYWTSTPSGGAGWGGGAPTPVVVRVVSPRVFSNSVEAIGTARATESVDIMAKVTDTVRSIGFDDAQSVEEGQILIELTDVEEIAGLAEARAGLSEANKQYVRIKDLVENGTATVSRLDSAQSDRDKARAKVQGLEAKLADRIIRAPFAGILGLRQVSVGSLVRPGDLITTLDDISVIKVDFSVSERYLAALKPGQQVEATNVAYPGLLFAGEVRSVDPRIDPVTRAVTIRAHLPNAERRLRPGMLLSMTLVMDSHEGLGVSESSLIPVKDDVFVYVVNADKETEKRKIEAGMRESGMVEVLSGLEEGEVVIVEGTSLIRRPGQKVRTGDEKPEERKKRGGKKGRDEKAGGHPS